MANERRLSDLLSEFARTLSTLEPLPRLRSLPGLDPHRATRAGHPNGASATSDTRSADHLVSVASEGSTRSRGGTRERR